MNFLYAILPAVILAQAGGDGGGGGQEGDGGGMGSFMFFLPLLIIGVLFYVMIINPERRKRKELEDTLSNLKENQRVVTIGGIVGSITSFSKDGKEVVIRVDEKTNTKIRVLRSAIARPLDVEEDVADKKVEKEV